MRLCPYSFRGSRPHARARKRCSPRTQKLHTKSRTQAAKSHNWAAGKKAHPTPTAKLLMRRRRPTQTRVRETGSGSLGSNGGGPNGGGATIRLSGDVLCVIFETRIASNDPSS